MVYGTKCLFCIRCHFLFLSEFMMIKRLKYKDHPILGNLELDFTTDGDRPYDSVIFAGNNGSGKTTILDSISTFLNRGSFEYFDYIEYMTSPMFDYKAVQRDPLSNPEFFAIIKSDGERINIDSGGSNGDSRLDHDPINLRSKGCATSKARAEYNTEKISSVKVSSLDSTNVSMDSTDNFTSLKQLIVDLDSQDAAAYMEENRHRAEMGVTPQSYNEFAATSLLSRFRNAFNKFFDRIQFDRVESIDGEHSIIFKKGEQGIPIDSLSTGEKQIVFRGAHLLKNNRMMTGGFVFVDEPEISMHPKWQNKILDYYQGLFTVRGTMTNQMFFATHSEKVISKALENRIKNLVIVLNDENGEIIPHKITTPSVLPTVTSAETNYLAFGIPSVDYHIELFGWLQEKNELASVKRADDFILSSPLYNHAIHHKEYVFARPDGHTTTYETLPTYIRNCIDHPDDSHSFTAEEFEVSITLLIELLK